MYRLTMEFADGLKGPWIVGTVGEAKVVIAAVGSVKPNGVPILERQLPKSKGGGWERVEFGRGGKGPIAAMAAQRDEAVKQNEFLRAKIAAMEARTVAGNGVAVTDGTAVAK